MKFEFDTRKSHSNQEKHGIDFIDAQALWAGAVFELSSTALPELRIVLVGKIGSICWTAIITKRSESIRIISVRRSRNEEKEEYKERAKSNLN